MDDTPCPLTTLPAETDHRYVGVAPGAPPETDTLKVTVAPASAPSSEVVTVILGHDAGAGAVRPQINTHAKEVGFS
jgi:hypothetical protein